MRRLVESWVEVETAGGGTIAAALHRLNEDCDMHITHSRLAEWRRGVYVPSQVALSYMLYHTLRWALRRAGIPVTQAQFDALCDAIWNHHERDGETFAELL